MKRVSLHWVLKNDSVGTVLLQPPPLLAGISLLTSTSMHSIKQLSRENQAYNILGNGDSWAQWQSYAGNYRCQDFYNL